MKLDRKIHSEFEYHLKQRSFELSNLFKDLRSFILENAPESNEILYNTHALVAVFSPTTKPTDAFCHIPIYTEHLNLGFNFGTLLSDPEKQLIGTGKYIRHLKIRTPKDYRNDYVRHLTIQAISRSYDDLLQSPSVQRKTISKIK